MFNTILPFRRVQRNRNLTAGRESWRWVDSLSAAMKEYFTKHSKKLDARQAVREPPQTHSLRLLSQARLSFCTLITTATRFGDCSRSHRFPITPTPFKRIVLT